MKAAIARFTGSYTMTKDESASLKAGRAIYLVQMDKTDPLTYHDSRGMSYRTGPDLITDMGSIPIFFQRVPCWAKDRRLRSYLLHDWMCQHKNIIQRYPCSTGWFLHAITRRRADELLYDMVQVDEADGSGAWRITAWSIWIGVRIGAMGSAIASWFKRS